MDDQSNRPDPPSEPTREKRSAVRYELAEPTLFVTDAELIRRMGVPEKVGRAALHVLDRTRDSGFPQKQALWGNRRYWPAVKQWFDRSNGVGSGKPREQTGGEPWRWR
jgi:hypothetical protein